MGNEAERLKKERQEAEKERAKERKELETLRKIGLEDEENL